MAKKYNKVGFVLFQEDAEDKEIRFKTLDDVLAYYPPEEDPKGNPARQVEVFLRYALTGRLERVHRAGVPDIVFKRGMTIEVKTGHGWAIEPLFDSQEALKEHMDERTNPMIRASHVAYLPYRARDGYDYQDVLFMSAHKFWSILGGQFDKLASKVSDGAWGVAIKPWITEGYAIKSSAKNEAIIREALIEASMTLEEFAEKHGIELFI